MAKPTNRDKEAELDESILDETPPNINEPQKEAVEPESEDTEEPKDQTPPEEVKDDSELEEKSSDEEDKEQTPPEDAESDVDREQRYKNQQSEAQIQAARNRALLDKIDQANQIPEPKDEEMIVFVNGRGGDWELLTPFEQETQRDIWKGKKRDSLLNEAVKTTKDIDAWAGQLDEFIDKSDGDPKYVGLSGHEAEFRDFAMKQSHRGVDIDSLLLPAFLQNLPKPKKRADLFLKGGGGDKDDSKPGKLTDTDQVSALRTTDPRAYKRAIKEGKVDLDI